MPWKLRWLGVIGATALAIGVYLAFARRSQLYPGLVVVGCICCAVFLLVNETRWSRQDGQDSGTP
jgi:hypothetical protein